MNTGLILLLLLAANQNGGCSGAGTVDKRYYAGRGACANVGNRADDDCGCAGTPVTEPDCGCGDTVSSRFEPRFDARPFSNQDCGCSSQQLS